MKNSIDELEQCFIEKYQQLNTAQQEAVDTTEGPVMVIAGPGTGKTQILAMRIANILRNADLQVSPSNILCLTFTDSGVAAMRNRLISIIGEAAYYVRIHTFHSFCNEIIKENPHKFSTINPITELEQIQLFNNILEKLDPNSPLKPFGDIYVYRRDLIFSISGLKRESITPDQVLEKTIACENFITKNADLIESFIAKHARSIKEEEKDLFLEKIHISNPDHPEFVSLFYSFSSKASKMAEFKASVKSFYEDNLKSIPRQKELTKVYNSYNKLLKDKKLYDFDDMILRVLNQFKHDDELLGAYQEQYQYILVDEFQDTNGAQNKILEYLTAGIEAKINPQTYQLNPNIFVVGDDDQSIYRFQGASVENIVHFLKRYETYVKPIVLENNYRSQQNILDTAQLSINNNESRITKLIPSITKKLKSSGEASNYNLQPVEVHETVNPQDEIYYIAQCIKELIDNGTPAREIAVLFRENKEAAPLMDYFSRLGINSSFEAGENILEDISICQLIDLLKVIEKPERSDLLFNVLNYEFIFQSETFRNAEISAIDIFRVNQNRRHKRSEEPKAFINYLIEDPRFKTWTEKLLELNRISLNIRADDLLEKVIKEFGYLDHILKQPDYIQEINKLESLFSELRSLLDSPLLTKKHSDQSLKTLSLHDLIAHLELLQDEGLRIKTRQLHLDTNSVRLMTAHKSKGLEFEYVFISSCLDKRWGNKTKSNKLKLPPFLIEETQSEIDIENEDERRLFFVALTRAKKKSYIYYHTENNKAKGAVPSVFITELLGLPEDIIIKHKNLPNEHALKQSLTIKFSDRIEKHIEEESNYINSLLDNYKMSVTHLNNFLECKRKFFYQNLLRVPSAKNRHSSFGTAVHEALEELFTSKNPSLKILLESFKEHLEKERLQENDHKDCLGHGERILTEYYNKRWESANKNVITEYDFSGYGVNIDGVTLTGKLDKIEILNPEATSPQEIIVVDYKTGNPSGKTARLEPGGDYHRQIVFYQLLCDTAASKAGFKYKMLAGEIDFVQAEKDGKFRREKITVTKSDLEILESEISSMYSSLKEHDFSKTEELDTCSNCDYKNICGR
jgi:DNA helicase II / ATP-dependent DNA helicase PcrA